MIKHPITLTFALALAASVALTGCDSSSRLSPEEHIQRAKDYESKGELASAVIELKNAVVKNPQNTQARLLLGQLYVEMGDGTAAEKELNTAQKQGLAAASVALPLANALQLQGRHKDVLEKLSALTGLSASGIAEQHVVKGKSYLGLGELQHAEQEFNAALNSQPDSPIAWHGQALLAYVKQQWNEADRWNEKALAQDPNSVRELALKGDIALARNDAKAAEAAYTRAVKLRPDYALYRIGLAIAQINTGKLAEAKTQLDTVLKPFPNNPTANYYRALVAYQLKDFESAKIHSEKALNNPDSQDLRARLLAAGANYAIGQFEAANKHVQLFLASAPSYEPARKLQAAIQLKMGQAVEAATSLEGLTNVSENDLKLLDAIGFAAIKQGKPDVGLEVLQRTVQARPGDPLARFRLGIAHSVKGDYQTGIDDLEKALRLNPNLDAAQAMLALNYLRAGNSDKALEAARHLQQRHPRHPDGFTLAGMALAQKAEFPEAKVSYNKALAIKPGDPNASANLAALLLQEGRRDQARRLLEDVLKKHPAQVRTILKLAELDVQAGQSSVAENRLKGALDNYPTVLPLRLALARLYIARQKPEMALALTEQIKGEQLSDPSVLELQGVAQLQTGRPNLAISSLEKASQLAPNSPSSHYQLALAYEQLNNLARASQELKIANKLAPNFGPTQFAQARLLAKSGKFDAAQALLDQLASAYPKDPSVMELRGDLALVQKRPKEAVVLYKSALTSQESNYLVIRLATAQLQAGDRNGGLGTLRGWVGRYPNDLYTRGALAEALLAAGQAKEARIHLEKIVERQPNNAAAINNLAWAMLQTGAIDEALAHSKQAYKLAPNQPQILDTYGMVLQRKGKTADALDMFNQAWDRAPDDVGISLHFAQALDAAGQPEKARKILNSLLAKKISLAERQQTQALLDKIK